MLLQRAFPSVLSKKFVMARGVVPPLMLLSLTAAAQNPARPMNHPFLNHFSNLQQLLEALPLPGGCRLERLERLALENSTLLEIAVQTPSGDPASAFLLNPLPANLQENGLVRQYPPEFAEQEGEEGFIWNATSYVAYLQLPIPLGQGRPVPSVRRTTLELKLAPYSFESQFPLQMNSLRLVESSRKQVMGQDYWSTERSLSCH